MSNVATSLQLEISSWVNGQFEIAEPRELPRRPEDLDDYPSWQSDPNSGITGTVYVAPDTVYYNAPAPGISGWWDMGDLPDDLGDQIAS